MYNKYIKLKNGFPILFSSSFTHLEIANIVTKKENVKSAGFWVLKESFDCYGKSVSLGIASEQCDNTVLDKCFAKNVFMSGYTILDSGIILHGPNTLTLNMRSKIEASLGKDRIQSSGLCYVHKKMLAGKSYLCCLNDKWEENISDAVQINTSFGCVV